MIEVHLYGKLRKYSGDLEPTSASVAQVAACLGDTVLDVVDRLGIPHDELGSNKFLNGRYANMATPVADGDRLGLFPDDMQLLYKWYFAPTQASAEPNSRSASLDSSIADSELSRTLRENPDSTSRAKDGAESEG